MKERWKIILTGRVQGVGLRYLIKIRTWQNSLTGWVGNIQKGQVLIEVEGSNLDLEKFVNWLKQNPGWSRVVECQVNKINLQNDNSFLIKFNL
ncbi:MAG: acylphosphatase [Patescibacteria group bacterium]